MSILVLMFRTHFPQVRSFPAVPCPSWEGKGRVLCDPRESNRQLGYTRINGKWYRLGLQLLAWWFEDFNKCFSQKTTIKLDKTVKDWKWAKACNKPRSIYLWKLSLFRWKQQVCVVPACGCSKLPTSVGVVFNQSRAGPQAGGFAAAARGAHLMWSIVSQSGNLGGTWLGRASVSASLRLWSFSRANSGG